MAKAATAQNQASAARARQAVAHRLELRQAVVQQEQLHQQRRAADHVGEQPRPAARPRPTAGCAAPPAAARPPPAQRPARAPAAAAWPGARRHTAAGCLHMTCRFTAWPSQRGLACAHGQPARQPGKAQLRQRGEGQVQPALQRHRTGRARGWCRRPARRGSSGPTGRSPRRWRWLLIITSQLLDRPGSAWRSICGPTMRHSTWRGVKPQATAASALPRRHRQEGAAQHLGEVGAEDEADGQHAGHPGVDVDVGPAQALPQRCSWPSGRRRRPAASAPGRARRGSAWCRPAPPPGRCASATAWPPPRPGPAPAPCSSDRKATDSVSAAPSSRLRP